MDQLSDFSSLRVCYTKKKLKGEVRKKLEGERKGEVKNEFIFFTF
jgi:hypothetical protein